MSRKSKVLFFLLNLASLLVVLSSCSFSAKTTERYLKDACTKTYDIIVVPGVPFTEKGWHRTMKARIYWSKYLFDKGIAKNIMYSGSSVYSPYYEGEIMALYAIAIGIPKENVLTETRAQHSTENIFYAYHKAKKMGFKNIALATDPFQAKQLKLFARLKISKEVGIIPIVFDTLWALKVNMIDPKINYRLAYNNNYVPLKERESFLKRIWGTKGRNIDYNAYK